MNDLTVVLYTANYISNKFFNNMSKYLAQAIGKAPLIIVSQKPINLQKWRDLGVAEVTNICVGEIGRSHLNIYKQALIGAKDAKTTYVALVEDDILYSPEHFTHRSSKGVFAYNMSVWSLYTWVRPPIFSYKDRRVLHSLICEKDLFIEAMEERFAKYPDPDKTPLGPWAEPGKYEKHLRVTERQTEQFYTNIANIAICHETALAFLNLGKRKKLGNLRVTALPYWGTADEVLQMYG